MEFSPRLPPGPSLEVDAAAPNEKGAGETDNLKHRYGIPSPRATRLRADQSEKSVVLLAFIMAFWRWLTSPPPVAVRTPSYPARRSPIAALPAPRARFVLLAPIHVPWPLRSSPPLA
jgi:hypothetical protein